MSRVLVVPQHGDPEVLEWQDRQAPEPRPDEVVVQTRAVGLAWSDLLQTRGAYAGGGPVPPFTPGYEIVGDVVLTGAETTGLTVGERVLAMLPGPGALAEHVAAPAAAFRSAPAQLSDTEAAAFPVSFLTADAALVTAGGFTPGHSVLVHAAAGGFGNAGVQLARAYGASLVLATAGSPDRCRHAESMGADRACGYDEFRAMVAEATGGFGVDIVLESVGGTTFDDSVSSVKRLGRVISVGASGGERPEKLKLPVLWHKSILVGGVHILNWMLNEPELLEPSWTRVLDAVARDTVAPVVGRTFAADDVQQAFAALGGRGVAGRVVVQF